jgi:hypothetical protein
MSYEINRVDIDSLRDNEISNERVVNDMKWWLSILTMWVIYYHDINRDEY